MDNIILAIETSIKAGSLAVLNETSVIDGWTGNHAVSRSEDLLPQIRRLLDANQIQLNQLNKIAVSNGPGSFTGIRVGIATAKALTLALGCSLVGVSIFEAIAQHISPETENKAVAVSAGRDLYFWQHFEGAVATTEGTTGNSALLESELREDELLFAEQAAYENLIHNDFAFAVKLKSVAGNYAELIGRFAVHKTAEQGTVKPFYLRPAVVLKKGF